MHMEHEEWSLTSTHSNCRLKSEISPNTVLLYDKFDLHDAGFTCIFSHWLLYVYKLANYRHLQHLASLQGNSEIAVTVCRN